VNQFNIRWKQVFQTKAVDGMSVSAANFHNAVMAIGIGEAANFFCSFGNHFRITKLIDKLHTQSFVAH
jgi:hypothetical protein